MTRRSKVKEAEEPIWAFLVHLTFNQLSDRECPEWGLEHVTASPFMRCDSRTWNTVIRKAAEVGMNMIVIDLSDGVRYESHPEIAVKRAWSVSKLRKELEKIRALGMEPVPMLNFSASHDVWLGTYSRCVSTDQYYKVCKDLIQEVIELFDKPRFLHLGMDEETAMHQAFYEYVVIRQYDLWWHDLLFLIAQVERKGVRPWVWSDRIWRDKSGFRAKMPRSVLQSNWYYGKTFSKKLKFVQAYIDLDKAGYDQVPGASNWDGFPDNFMRTVQFCRRHIHPKRLVGFLQTVWKPMIEPCLGNYLEALEGAEKGVEYWHGRVKS